LGGLLGNGLHRHRGVTQELLACLGDQCIAHTRVPKLRLCTLPSALSSRRVSVA
jgi:hypothetical protein